MATAMPPAPAQEPVDVILQFSPEAYTTLQRLIQVLGKSDGEVISEALALLDFATRLREDGGRLVADRSGKFREVLPV